MYCISAPAPREKGIEAQAAATCAARPPPTSLAMQPVSTTLIACTSAEKNRKPTSEVPNKASAKRPKNGVSGGEATKPPARGRPPSIKASFLRVNPERPPTDKRNKKGPAPQGESSPQKLSSRGRN